MRVVATAGHVDHGKSSLVLALTGTDPDRFEEEKRRGLTIDLGFAHIDLPSGEGISFIDVPGHVRFLRNMLAGVGAVDACLFVVAATEGWKPQSEEHLRILELLGVRHGVIALTKVDLVDDDWRDIAVLEVLDHVAGTFLADAPIVPVAAGPNIQLGLDDLRIALDALVAETPAAHDRGRPRLWVDRVFAARGSGTVVTGTLSGGTFAGDARVTVGPGHHDVRVRSLQSHGQTVASIGPGNRVAINLAGIEHTEVQRGDAVVHGSQWLPTRRFDASLHVLARLDHDVSRRGAYVAYIGSGEFPAKVRVLGSEVIEPGGSGLVRLHLETDLALVPGDRYILRESGRGETIGGGEVLDIHPVLPASKARPDRDVQRLVRERGWVRADELERLTGFSHEPTIGDWVVLPEAIARLTDSVRARVQQAGAAGIDIAAFDDRERTVLATLDDMTIDNGTVRAVAEIDPLAEHPFVAAVFTGWFTPPDSTGVDRNELRQLVKRGWLVERDGVCFHPAAIDAAALVAADLSAAHPDGFTVAQFRDATGSSRKHSLPLMAELDGRGVTRRRDDVRVAGPRMPLREELPGREESPVSPLD
ncbi:MAG: selB [Ilumatobacteraceae bacterium]|nr:selB [Ilumatobacteraceae bacterium]